MVSASPPSYISQDRHASPDNELLERWHRDGDRSAHELLIGQFTPLARSLARRYAHTSEPFEDLLQVTYLGLLKALERFDPEREVALPRLPCPRSSVSYGATSATPVGACTCHAICKSARLL